MYVPFFVHIQSMDVHSDCAPEQCCSSPLMHPANAGMGLYSPGVRYRNLHPSSSRVSTSKGLVRCSSGIWFQSQKAGLTSGWLAWAPCPSSYTDCLESLTAALGYALSSHHQVARAEAREVLSLLFLLQNSQPRRKVWSHSSLFRCANGLCRGWRSLQLLKWVYV